MSLLAYMIRMNEAEEAQRRERVAASWRQHYKKLAAETGLSVAEVERRHREKIPLEGAGKPKKAEPAKKSAPPAKKDDKSNRPGPPPTPSSAASAPSPKMTQTEWAAQVIGVAKSMRCSVAEALRQAKVSADGVTDVDAAHALALAQAAHTGQSYRDAYVELFGGRYVSGRASSRGRYLNG